MPVECSLCGKKGGHPEGRCPELNKSTSKTSAKEGEKIENPVTKKEVSENGGF